MKGERTDSGRAHRIPVDVPVLLRDRGASYSGLAKNIGPGGIFVATGRALGIGEQITVTILTTGDARPIEALTEVRWCRPVVAPDQLPVGVGLRFIDTPLRAMLLTNELNRSS
jgi:uncharacterized protein (TIGR02266 family)